MKPIAIFYHGLFFIWEPISSAPPKHLPNAGCIVSNQLTQMINSGLWDAASEIHVGINGGDESVPVGTAIIPSKAKVEYHGLDTFSENRTIVMLHDWAKTHPGWNVIYLHSKGATHDPNSDYGSKVSAPWREAMMNDLVVNWRQCVADLNAGNDIACMVWLWEQGWDKSQHIPAGNFLWTTSDFVANLPSIFLRERIKLDGIGAATARFEAEVFWGNGPRPNVRAYRTALPF
jgi:hypothetical protein